ncbi:MAG: amino acid permease [bacterium]|nr:amino acid permease [bacterium]
MQDSGLKRVLGLPAVSFIAIGSMIGGGVFVFTGIVMKIIGPALPIAYALAVIPVFISMLPLAMLGSAIPATGANYRYPSRMVSPGLAFTGIWVYALASFFGQIPLYAQICTKYAAAVFPGLPPVLTPVLILTFLYIVNILGLKLAAQVQAALVLVLISALIYYASSGIPAIDSANFSNIFEKGTGKLVLGVALLSFTYFGANGILELGGEIINPGKVIPRAFFIAFPVVAVIYVGIAIATVGPVHYSMATGTEDSLVMVTVSKLICSNAGVMFFIFGGAIVALLTTLNAIFIMATKSMLIMVQDNLLPQFFGRVHKKFATPWVLLTIIWFLSVLGVISGFDLKTLASYSAIGGLIIFFPLQLASFKLPKLYPEKYKESSFKLKGFWLKFCPSVGILMVVFFCAILFADLKEPLKIGCFFLFILSGILFYVFRKKYLLKQGINIKENIKNDPEWKA